MTIVVLLVLARLLQPKDFGIVALANGITLIVGVLLERGFPQAIIQRKTLDTTVLSTAFWGTLGVGVLLSALCASSASVIAAVFEEPLFAPVLQLLSLSIVLEAASGIPRALLHRELHFRPLALHALIAAVLSGIVGIYMAIQGMGAWSLVAQVLIDRTVRMILLYATVAWKPSLTFCMNEFKELCEYAFHSTGYMVVEYMGMRATEAVIAAGMGFTALGYYALANKCIMTVAQFVYIAFPRIGIPLFARMRDDTNRIARVLLEILRVGSVIAFPLFAGLAFIAPDFVVVVFGDKWETSVPVLQVLCGAGLLLTLFSWNNTVLLAIGKPRMLLRISTLTTLLTVVLLLLVFPLGLAALAAVQVVRIALTAILTFRVLQTYIPLSTGEYIRAFLAPISSCALMIGALSVVPDVHSGGALTQLGVRIGMSAVVYAASMAVLSPHVLRELHTIALHIRSTKTL